MNKIRKKIRKLEENVIPDTPNFEETFLLIDNDAENRLHDSKNVDNWLIKVTKKHWNYIPIKFKSSERLIVFGERFCQYSEDSLEGENAPTKRSQLKTKPRLLLLLRILLHLLPKNPPEILERKPVNFPPSQRVAL